MGVLIARNQRILHFTVHSSLKYQNHYGNYDESHLFYTQNTHIVCLDFFSNEVIII